MSRTFITKVALAAIAVTIIGNVPAKANENLLGALAVVAGIALVGKVISDEIGDNSNDRVTQRANDRDYYRYQQSRNFKRHGVKPRPLPKRANRRLLPENCLRRFGERRVFGKRCLDRRYGFTNSLPRDCRVKFRVDGRKYDGFSGRCLRREGYRLARY